MCANGTNKPCIIGEEPSLFTGELDAWKGAEIARKQRYVLVQTIVKLDI